jgi:NAD(P)H-quinone oxidoreductase subunit 6
MSEVSLAPALFYLLAAATVGFAAIVAFSRNIVHSAFALVGSFMGVAGVYVALAADFLAIVQILLYIGGIVVLILFAVMLTHRIADVRVSNRTVGSLPALAMMLVVGGSMGWAILNTTWHTVVPAEPTGTTASIGNAFLTTYVLPFELASVVLLAALIGAVVLSRKELRD